MAEIGSAGSEPPKNQGIPMSVLKPLPCDPQNITAWVDKQQPGLLWIHAKGENPESVYGARIKWYPFTVNMRGVFFLEGWCGPLQVVTPFEVTKDFPGIPHQGVIRVITANYPEGILVPVQNVYLANKMAGLSITGGSVPSAEILKNPSHVLYVFKGVPFDIRWPAKVDQAGSIEEKSDPRALTINTAGLVRGNIVWNYTALDVGTTEVKVVVYGGILPYILEETFEIHVSPPMPRVEDPAPQEANGATNQGAQQLVQGQQQANGETPQPQPVVGIAGGTPSTPTRQSLVGVAA